ncbi:cupredoxin domain-containing protein [Mesorhizobium sp. YR577]|jgi:plastocyanin|uniref:cupredoxin domain-containing protein n=1 Tax=Mesorhizobium sp. YR577 TaxID=1884373 RepID=UPI0008E13389|nr:cupredoxin domain-containing protein [Mesorhizobium sp. YR577]SFT80816.1 Cupredoxin-like domain-containing protein [Mesorhizobium sp. YR577]
MKLSRLLALSLGATALVSLAASASAATDQQSFTITIKDHRFTPATLKVPAGAEFDLVVVNADPTAEEFESQDFHVEKVIQGGKQATFHVGPLTAGSYGFFGERHEDTALGNMFAE